MTTPLTEQGSAAIAALPGSFSNDVTLNTHKLLLVSPGTAATDGINKGQLDALGAPSGRNRIINGNFAINQRGYVSGTATGTANQYTLDRWRVVVSGQSATFAASGNGNLVTAPAGGLEQVIEGANIEGGAFTLSWTGTATATVNGSAVANKGQVTLPANTNATVRFSGGTVGLVQLEAGSVATPFERRSYGLELALCQRYYCVVETYARAYASTAGSWWNVPVYWPVNMRAAPTTTIPSNGGALNVSNNSVGQATARGGRYEMVAAAVGDTYVFQANITANAEL